MYKLQWLTMETDGFYGTNSTITIGTALENLDNEATAYQNTMAKLLTLNEELERSKYTFIVKMMGLTAQLKVEINTIQYTTTKMHNKENHPECRH